MHVFSRGRRCASKLALTRKKAHSISVAFPSTKLLLPQFRPLRARSSLTLLALVHELDALLDELLGNIDETLDVVRHVGCVVCVC